MSTQQQTLFDIYGEKGLPIELISVNVLRTIIATIGIFFNVSLVYVTLKSKILNSPCHLLIAFDCFVSSFYQLGSWVSITVLFNPGHQFIPIRPCCLQILPPFQVGFTSSFTAIYLISLDRLISVIFPFWYNQKINSKITSKKPYFLSMLFPLILCPALIIYADYQIVYTVPETIQVICVPHECSWGWANDLIYYIFILFYGLTLINYIIVWIVLKIYDWKSNNNNLASSFIWTRRILKTLTIIMILNIIGFSMNTILRLTVPRLNLNLTQKSMAIHSLAILTCFVMSSNAPIFFTFSEEYKNAFLNVFKNKKTKAKITTVNSANNCKLRLNNYINAGLPQIK